jgi:hypothetical protein
MEESNDGVLTSSGQANGVALAGSDAWVDQQTLTKHKIPKIILDFIILWFI